jgi:hypothetical protein
MTIEVLNNIGTLKKNQSIQVGFFMELSDDKILDMFFFVDFRAPISLDA